MKKVQISEGQLSKLMENLMESSITDGSEELSNIEGIGSDQVTAAPIIHDKNGDEEYPDQRRVPNFPKTLSPQQWGTVRGRQSTAAI